MDKVKDSVKSADEKLGTVVDKEKIDSEIRRQEKSIEEFTKQIGDKVLEDLRSGKSAIDADISDIYEDIKKCEMKIADLKTQKDNIGKKE